MRFLFQWWRSERVGASVVPVEFWYFSLGGSLLLLLMPFTGMTRCSSWASSSGFVVYLRNLQLTDRPRRAEA